MSRTSFGEPQRFRFDVAGLHLLRLFGVLRSILQSSPKRGGPKLRASASQRCDSSEVSDSEMCQVFAEFDNGSVVNTKGSEMIIDNLRVYLASAMLSK